MILDWPLKSLASFKFEKDSFLNILFKGPEELDKFPHAEESQIQDQDQEKQDDDEEENELIFDDDYDFESL